MLQRHWVYLKDVFSLGEIQRQLEPQCRRFERVDEYFRNVMKGFELSQKVYLALQREVSSQTLQKMIQDCEVIGKALGDFMDQKRERCPRLYFLSNEELVDIFGIEKLVAASRAPIEAPKRTFIQNLFEGVLSLQFRENDNAILGLMSKEHEILPFMKPVFTERDPPDLWLNNLES